MNVFNKDIVLVIVVLIILAAVFQSFIAPYPQHAKEYVDFANVNKAPSAQFLLGTDSYGVGCAEPYRFSVGLVCQAGLGKGVLNHQLRFGPDQIRLIIQSASLFIIDAVRGRERRFFLPDVPFYSSPRNKVVSLEKN